MNKGLKPTIGLILILVMMFTGLSMLGWGVKDKKLTVNTDKVTSNLKILKPKNDKEPKEKSSD